MKANFEITLTKNEYNTLQGLREYYLHNEIINSTFESCIPHIVKIQYQYR